MSNRTLSLNAFVTLASGREVHGFVDLHVSYNQAYGADADGNRGEPTLFLDEVVVKDNFCVSKDGECLSDNDLAEARALIAAKGEEYFSDIYHLIEL